MEDPRREYERLLAPIESRMMRVIGRIVADPGEAEDALQEALITIWKRWAVLRRHPNPQALVLRICVNAAYDALRRRARREKRVASRAIPEDVADGAPSALEAVAGTEQRALIMRAIAALSRNQARAILMHAVEEIPYRDIASAMNCREVTVRKHVARARARLRGLLSCAMPAVREEEGSHA
jgi:RNA polymerase sigma-70 factor (ECF subfamily)